MEGITFSVRQSNPKCCATCGETDKKLKHCGKCKEVFYCNVECQKNHWPTHKRVCVIPSKKAKDPFNMAEFLRAACVVSTDPRRAPDLTEEQKKDAKELIGLPLDSILAPGAGRLLCWLKGQNLFEKYRKQNGGDSLAARDAVVNICDWIRFNCNDGRERKSRIEAAWDDIGDERWRWQS